MISYIYSAFCFRDNIVNCVMKLLYCTITVTCPCSPRTYATLKYIRSSSSSSFHVLNHQLLHHLYLWVNFQSKVVVEV